MSILDQVNAFHKNNRQQHLIIERPRKQHVPVYSHVNEDNSELKIRSFDVYTSKHLVITNRKPTLPFSERARLDEILLPTIERALNNQDGNHRRRQRRRPFYRKSLFHTYSSMSTQADLEQITARGIKAESRTTLQTCPDNASDNESTDMPRYRLVPPPSPSDSELERVFYQTSSHSLLQPTPVDRGDEEDIPFRLPLLRRARKNPSPKDIRSTLSNYLQRYY